VKCLARGRKSLLKISLKIPEKREDSGLAFQMGNAIMSTYTEE